MVERELKINKIAERTAQLLVLTIEEKIKRKKKINNPINTK